MFGPTPNVQHHSCLNEPPLFSKVEQPALPTLDFGSTVYTRPKAKDREIRVHAQQLTEQRFHYERN